MGQSVKGHINSTLGHGYSSGTSPAQAGHSTSRSLANMGSHCYVAVHSIDNQI